MNKIKDIINYKISKSKNDKYITNHILEYLGYQCDKCYQYSHKKLTFVISFNDGKRDYNFKYSKKSNIGFKKFCEKCIYCNSSPCKIYVEV